jgi:tetratricopeptide (TPR) repeat protein
MFLTKKGLCKIIIMVACYFILGSICIALGILCAFLQLESRILFIGLFCYLCCPLIFFWGRHGEGKGKLIVLANKLLRTELRPAEFVARYEELKNNTDLVICKPSLEVLQLVLAAHDSLDNKDAAMAAVDEMIAIAGEKKKAFAKLLKADLLYSHGTVEEAEALFTEARAGKLDLMSQGLVDAIMKSDRALAMGDYKTVELYNLQLLSRTFPKPDNLNKVILHIQLGEVYEKLQDTEKAIGHYQYCAEHGGETAMKDAAKAALERLR